jgi:hypothetical protein
VTFIFWTRFEKEREGTKASVPCRIRGRSWSSTWHSRVHTRLQYGCEYGTCWIPLLSSSDLKNDWRFQSSFYLTTLHFCSIAQLKRYLIFQF